MVPQNMNGHSGHTDFGDGHTFGNESSSDDDDDLMAMAMSPEPPSAMIAGMQQQQVQQQHAGFGYGAFRPALQSWAAVPQANLG